MRRIYELPCDDIPGMGGEVIVERWAARAIRLLLIADNAIHHDQRANILISRDEAARLGRQLLRFADEP